MSYDPLNSPSQAGYATGQAIDAGLQAYMRSIYNTMSLGLVITGLTAFGVSMMPSVTHFLFNSALGAICMLVVPLIVLLVGFNPRRIATKSAEQLKLTFFAYAVLMGMMFSYVFLAYTGESVARVFFITAATFAGTSLYGYTAKRDLTGLGHFMSMGVIGIFLALLVNMFFHSAMVMFVVSVIGVVSFTGLVAWETQAFKRAYRAGDEAANEKTAIFSALSLYIDFINIFQFLLNLLGDRR